MSQQPDSEALALPLRAIESALQSLLALDPQSRRRLQRLAGCSLGIEVAGAGLCVVVRVDDGELRLRTAGVDECAAVIRGGPLALMRMLRSDGVESLFRGDVALRGEAAVAKGFKRLFDTLDIDWEEQCSRLIGDYPAFRLMRSLRSFHTWWQRSHSVLLEDTADYLREERKLLGNRHEVRELYDDVDKLRDDAARLSARLALLRNDRTSS